MKAKQEQEPIKIEIVINGGTSIKIEYPSYPADVYDRHIARVVDIITKNISSK